MDTLRALQGEQKVCGGVVDMRLAWIMVLGAEVAMGATGPVIESEIHAKGAEKRLARIIEANVVATHAYQVGLASKSKKADKTCWKAAGLSLAELRKLVGHQRRLLSAEPKSVKDWVAGRETAFDPSRDLDVLLKSPLKAATPELPVNVVAAHLRSKTGCSRLQAQAVTSLLQMALDVARDGDELQDMFALYAALGLPVHTRQLGLKEKTDEEFLKLAKVLAPRMCPCPFPTDAVVLQMTFRKLWNWGHRHTGERDKKTMAMELLAEPDILKLTANIKKLPAQRIAVIGHSYTMNVHWSSPSAFVPIVFEMIGRLHPKVEMRQWQAGGMNPSRGDCRKFFKEALDWKPDQVLLVLGHRNRNDPPALKKMVSAFVAAGAKVAMFDTLTGDLKPQHRVYPDPTSVAAIARKTGTSLIEVAPLLNASQERDTFLSLDGVHMTEPYHRLMAKAWLKHLCAGRDKEASPRE